jgi:SAM-dependent methyltransferase
MSTSAGVDVCICCGGLSLTKYTYDGHVSRTIGKRVRRKIVSWVSALIRAGFPAPPKWRARAEARLTFSGRQVIVCSECGLGVIDPIPTSAELAAYYEGLFWTSLTGVPDDEITLDPVGERACAQLDFIRRYGVLAPESRALEFGAGSAGFGRRFKELCPSGTLDLVEPSKAMRRLHEAEGTAHRLFSSLREPDSAYDLIGASHSLEHVEDAPGVLRRFCELLRPGGHLLIEVPRCSTEYYRAETQDTPHTWFLTEDSLARMAIAAQLEVVAIEAWCAGWDSPNASEGGKHYYHNPSGSVVMALFRKPGQPESDD